MSARQLVLSQRAELLRAVCRGGSPEALEGALDLLLARGLLVWEDYQAVRVPGRALCSGARDLLDLVHTKGEEACALLLHALRALLPEAQREGLLFGPPRGGSDLEDSGGESSPPDDTAVRTLVTDRPGLVRRLRGCVDGALQVLVDTGSFTACDCDDVQLPVYTPSQQARRLLDQVSSKGESAAQVLLQYIQHAEQRSPPAKNQEPIPPPELLQYQKKLRSSVSAQSHFLSTYGGTSSLSLDDIYTEGHLELAQGQGAAQGSSEALSLEDMIFGPAGTVNEDADTVLVSGEAGCGKSTLLQRLHLLWARGAALRGFALLFPFSCRRLGAERRELSFRDLLFSHCCWPDGDQDLLLRFVLAHPHLVLLTFDGLDELGRGFTDERRHCSPTQPAPVPTLLFNLLQGTLLKGARKLVTGRPEAAGPALTRYLRKELVLKGFTPGGIEAFVRKHHREPATAAKVLQSLRSNSALLGLCHTPVFCWIVSVCYRELLGCGGGGGPQTVTDVYLMVLQHFFQHHRPGRGGAPGAGWLREHLETTLRLGRLAFDGVGASCYVFSGADLQGGGVTEEDVSVGFLVLSKDPASSSSSAAGGVGVKRYEFLHVTVQCFFAALHVVLGDGGRSAVARLFRPRDREPPGLAGACLGPCLTPGGENERASEETAAAAAADTPNLQITTTFVSGLLSRRHADLLLQSCTAASLDRKRRRAVKCLSKGMQRHFKSIPRPVEGEKKSMHAMPDFVWLIKCIYEMQESRIARDAVAKLEVEHLKLTYCNIGPVECTALAYVLRHLTGPVGLQLDHNSVGDVGVEQLLPCLHVCGSLYLRHNNITDEGICKLIEKGMSCESFQKIALFNNKLTDACTQHFAQLLKTRQNFIALRLGNNNITAEGAKRLAEGLKFNQSLQFLGLWGNKIGDSGAEAIAKALEDNKTLVWLSLVENGVGNAGAQTLGHVIMKTNTLQELWLTKNCISRTGVEFLIKALESNTSVKAVWLGGNNLSPEEVKEMSLRESRLTFD